MATRKKAEPAVAGEETYGQRVAREIAGDVGDAPTAEAEAVVVPAFQSVLREIPIDWLVPWEGNPRKSFKGIEDLAASIRDKGVVLPLIVRPLAGSAAGAMYQVIAGERRLRAGRILHDAGELNVMPCVVRPLTDLEALEIAVVENNLRDDVDPMEEAAGFAALRAHGLTRYQIARRIGRTTEYVQSRLVLMDLPEDWQEMVRENQVTLAAARFAAIYPTRVQPRRQYEDRLVPGRPLGVHDIASYEAHSGRLSYVPWALDAEVVRRKLHQPGTDAHRIRTCAGCSDRSDAQVTLFGEATAALSPLCLNANCWNQKWESAWAELAEPFLARGARWVGECGPRSREQTERTVALMREQGFSYNGVKPSVDDLQGWCVAAHDRMDPLQLAFFAPPKAEEPEAGDAGDMEQTDEELAQEYHAHKPAVGTPTRPAASHDAFERSIEANRKDAANRARVTEALQAEERSRHGCLQRIREIAPKIRTALADADSDAAIEVMTDWGVISLLGIPYVSDWSKLYADKLDEDPELQRLLGYVAPADAPVHSDVFEADEAARAHRCAFLDRLSTTQVHRLMLWRMLEWAVTEHHVVGLRGEPGPEQVLRALLIWADRRFDI